MTPSTHLRRRLRFALIALAVTVLVAGPAGAGVTFRVEADFRSGVHEVEIRASSPLATAGPGYGSVAVSGTIYASLRWRRSDYKGDPWFESARGRIAFEVDPVSRKVRLHGSLPEFFHDGFFVIDVIVDGEPDPFAGAWYAAPTVDRIYAGAGASGGVRSTGRATGTVRSSLGTLTNATGLGRWALAASAGYGISPP